jgi:NTE family protein
MKDNQKIGLALGSGGMKGFAHIGVLRELQNRNIKVSYISGTSAGALIGGIYLAFDQNMEKLEKAIDTVDTKEILNLFMDLTLDGGLVNGDKVKKFINDMVGNVNIEDLPLPFSVVATNFETGLPKLFTKGNLAEAVRASFSLPLIFKPAKYDGHFYVDGGTTIPVPVEPVIALGAEKVISVCLDSEVFPKEIVDAKGRINVNSAERIIYQMIRDLSLKCCEKSDVLINPDFSKVENSNNIGGFYNRKKLIQLGLDSAKEALDKAELAGF